MAAPVQSDLGNSPLAFGASCDGANARVALTITETQPTSVADEDGSYTIQGGHSATTGLYIAYWLLTAATATSGTRTVTTTGGGASYALMLWELSGEYSSGAATPTRTDQSSGSGSPWASGALTASADNGMYLGLCLDLSGNSTDITVDSPATESEGVATLVTGYYEQGTAASFDMTGTLTGSGLFWGAALGVFVPAGGGGGTAVPVFVHNLRQQGIA